MSIMDYHHRPDFIHHQKTTRASLVREIIFGMEDGMVSTMGAITGIASGTGDHFVVVLSGFVIISVESISMAVGSYLSSKSEQEIDQRKLSEERFELKTYPAEEREELTEMYIADGWPEALAKEMSGVAATNKDLFLQEMAYRELKIIPGENEHPLQNGAGMGVAYIIGGSLPLLPYIIMSSPLAAIPVSVVATLGGLFVLGALTTKYSKRVWWKAGLEMLLLAAAAGAIGYFVGKAVDSAWIKK